MLSSDADPVVREARELRDAKRRVRAALSAELAAFGESPHAEGLRREFAGLREREEAMLEDPERRTTLASTLDERARVLRTAVRARAQEAERTRERRRADELEHRAIARGAAPTPGERFAIADLREGAFAEHADWADAITTSSRRDGVLEALGTLRLREYRSQLREGLLLTEQMRGIISEALPALASGEPVLLLGETGGAKTALAEHLARHGVRREPELVSGYGDITGAQLIGAHELRAGSEAQGGATVSVFVPGPLLRAMIEGRPVILDEINAMPAEFLKRLNRILQLRPGDRFGVQENAGRQIDIAPGFAILATANEQTPHRYRGIDRLSAELVNRFGANSYRVRYPDSGLDYADFPAENALIATAAAVDDRGELPLGLSADELIRVARAAFISQQVFAGRHGEGFSDFVSTDREIDGRPGLEEAVLAPRTLVAILRKVAVSAGSVPLDHALARFVEGIMHREDRRVLALILEGQGFRL